MPAMPCFRLFFDAVFIVLLRQRAPSAFFSVVDAFAFFRRLTHPSVYGATVLLHAVRHLHHPLSSRNVEAPPIITAHAQRCH